MKTTTTHENPPARRTAGASSSAAIGALADDGHVDGARFEGAAKTPEQMTFLAAAVLLFAGRVSVFPGKGVEG